MHQKFKFMFFTTRSDRFYNSEIQNFKASMNSLSEVNIVSQSFHYNFTQAESFSIQRIRLINIHRTNLKPH